MNIDDIVSNEGRTDNDNEAIHQVALHWILCVVLVIDNRIEHAVSKNKDGKVKQDAGSKIDRVVS